MKILGTGMLTPNYQNIDVFSFLKDFHLDSFDLPDFFLDKKNNNETKIEYINIGKNKFPKFINEFWTSKQRQASSLHEIAYRACFKPQLVKFFIELFTSKDDFVYDPFAGRGTTAIESGLLERNTISNDINPLSKILCMPRFFVPDLEKLKERLRKIPIRKNVKTDIDLSMFYHSQTEKEIISLKEYLLQRKKAKLEDEIDMWIRMIATNRLTGHSVGFFSVYTLPPNQAVSPESQLEINKKRGQIPEYRNVKEIILKKTKDLIKNVTPQNMKDLRHSGMNSLFLSCDARYTKEIPDKKVQLTVTSPPFLDVVQYDKDNWLRCWFNSIDSEEISNKITMSKTLKQWCSVMGDVFLELYRMTKNNGWVAFEVGEIRNGRYNLDEYVVPLGLEAGFKCEGILVNKQKFTKTANIWGIKNNIKGTNTNRIVLFKK